MALRGIAVLIGAIMLAANACQAQDRAPIDTRSGTVRIYISALLSG
jgi:hypothetical protein